MHILITRIDSIGDVILTFPLVGFIKQHFPKAQISFLGKTYTKDIIDCEKNVDNFLNWDTLVSEKNPIETLKKHNFTHCIHALPKKEVVKLAFQAKIPKRIGVNRRLHNWIYCNIRTSFSRKKSDLHEAQLNILLAKPLIKNFELPSFKSLHKLVNFNQKEVALPTSINLILSGEPNAPLIILHPKSQGSAIEWGLDNFETLALNLAEKSTVLITGTKKEGELLHENGFNPKHKNIYNITGQLSLAQFITLIAKCNGLVAASTGPLHIASVLGKKAVGIYSPLKPIHPGRWAPIGLNSVALTQKTGCDLCKKPVDCTCMQKISPLQVERALGF
jgi:heptosyltransferase-3